MTCCTLLDVEINNYLQKSKTNQKQITYANNRNQCISKKPHIMKQNKTCVTIQVDLIVDCFAYYFSEDMRLNNAQLKKITPYKKKGFVNWSTNSLSR